MDRFMVGSHSILLDFAIALKAPAIDPMRCVLVADHDAILLVER